MENGKKRLSERKQKNRTVCSRRDDPIMFDILY